MAKFKNLITQTGSFLFNEQNHEFNGEFETEDKKIIAHLKARSDWEEIKEIKKPNEGNKTPDDSLEAKNKAELVKIAEALKIETKGLNKEQILEAIKKHEEENELDLDNIELESQEIEDLITLADSLEIETKDLTKEQLIEAIKNKKDEL